MGSLRRKEREREAHRKDILLAAEAVFAEKGFRGATMQEIANRAEFAVGSLYNLFDSKEDIYRSLVELRVRQYVDQVAANVAGAQGPEQKVRAAVETKLDMFQANSAFFRVMNDAVSGSDAGGLHSPSRTVVEVYTQYLKLLEQVLADGIVTGAFREADPHLMALSVDGISTAVIEHFLYTGQNILDETTAQEIEELVFNGILKEGA